jgi:hypothetical protein
MDRIRDTRNTENSLKKVEAKIVRREKGASLNAHTSVDPGNIPSLALRRAPEASWISLILEPCFPMTEPIRELGIMNLMVTARLPGTDGTSKGSSFIRRTMSPKAYSKRRRATGWERPVKAEQNKTDLWDCIEWTANIQDTLGIARNTFRDHHTGAAFLTDFVDVGTTLTNDDWRVLGDDEASHMNVSRRRSRTGSGNG